MKTYEINAVTTITVQIDAENKRDAYDKWCNMSWDDIVAHESCAISGDIDYIILCKYNNDGTINTEQEIDESASEGYI